MPRRGDGGLGGKRRQRMETAAGSGHVDLVASGQIRHSGRIHRPYPWEWWRRLQIGWMHYRCPRKRHICPWERWRRPPQKRQICSGEDDDGGSGGGCDNVADDGGGSGGYDDDDFVS
uniref:Uncharacterized protein n=1 Tax=Oryza sativa subsp. japonica TaxID=39947 RepID=Q6Z6N9_ORYSJ|nr:hypothetical protein [Oryza sativa Japonica Group]BAD30992.1 hypothetical protein [Oryza sativa Japonica Group]